MPDEKLSKCRDCDRKVSNNAEICPHCGAPKPALSEVCWNEFKRDLNVRSAIDGSVLLASN
ncbi:MAG: hypothetical protein AB1599_07730 [Planctomycetota bacterium]